MIEKDYKVLYEDTFKQLIEQTREIDKLERKLELKDELVESRDSIIKEARNLIKIQKAQIEEYMSSQKPTEHEVMLTRRSIAKATEENEELKEILSDVHSVTSRFYDDGCC